METSTSFRGTRRVFASLTVALVPLGGALAATWIGGASGEWMDDANWDPAVPSAVERDGDGHVRGGRVGGVLADAAPGFGLCEAGRGHADGTSLSGLQHGVGQRHHRRLERQPHRLPHGFRLHRHRRDPRRRHLRAYRGNEGNLLRRRRHLHPAHLRRRSPSRFCRHRGDLSGSRAECRRRQRHRPRGDRACRRLVVDASRRLRHALRARAGTPRLECRGRLGTLRARRGCHVR